MYRDDLAAAQARIEVLENELKKTLSKEESKPKRIILGRIRSLVSKVGGWLARNGLNIILASAILVGAFYLIRPAFDAGRLEEELHIRRMRACMLYCSKLVKDKEIIYADYISTSDLWIIECYATEGVIKKVYIAKIKMQELVDVK